MRRLILLRHSLTDYNIPGSRGVICGMSDPPLNSAGHGEARQLATMFQDIPLQNVYSSELKRAKETACLIAAAKNMSVLIASELNEINYGQWEGLTKDELVRRYTAEFGRFVSNPVEFYPPGGEEPESCADRIYKWVEKWGDDNALAVTHKTVIRLLLCRVLGLPLLLYRQRFDVKISSSTVLIHTGGGWRIDAINYGATSLRVLGK